MKELSTHRLLLAFAGADTLACAFASREEWKQYNALRSEILQELKARGLHEPWAMPHFSAIAEITNTYLQKRT
jgi:hypothetical protein